MNETLLPDRSSAAAIERTPAVVPEALAFAESMLDAIRNDGESVIVSQMDRFGERGPDGLVTVDRDRMRSAVDRLPVASRRIIESAAARIRSFAETQFAALSPVRVESGPVSDDGFEAGHDLVPIESVGCYAPGGRYPLPSSVLMTAIPARVAGVSTVRVASPNPTEEMLAAAWFAGADSMLCAGGVHAIGAFAQGCFGPRCDMIVGPGNRYVTAAKALVAGPVHGPVKIDGIAGPSELLVLADGSADPEVIAADLIAQAEHDPDAGVWVATTESSAGPMIRDAVRRRVDALPEPNRSTATTSLRRGGIFDVGDRNGLVAIADRIAAEHLEILTEDPDGISGRVRHAGGVFIGGGAGEVFGDYGIGPNHVLPTGGTARFTAGLSVLDFLRVRTWLRAASAIPKAAIVEEIATFARLEGLEGHAQAAEVRLVSDRVVPPATVVAD